MKMDPLMYHVDVPCTDVPWTMEDVPCTDVPWTMYEVSALARGDAKL